MTVVDTGTTPVPAGFDHEALFYRGTADFLAGVLPFLREGLARGEAVVVAEPRDRLDLIREALGDDAAGVDFLDMAEIGANPPRIIAVWAAAVDEHVGSGRGLRGLGEPAWHGRRTVELVECQLHELLLNVAFDAGPAWRLMCPYDEELLPRTVCRGALRAHPVRATSRGRLPSADYARDGHVAALAEPLPRPRPREGVLSGRYGPADLPAVRRTVVHWARTCGLSEDQVEALQLAASELATNSVRHGGGGGTVAMWAEPGAAMVEFSDAGQLRDPLAGRRHPSLEQECGRGLYLVNQLCDLVQVRTSPRGTTARVLAWL
jgi:anti-sigma regulatory factor (Ser/Thr protein kinase)